MIPIVLDDEAVAARLEPGPVMAAPGAGRAAIPRTSVQPWTQLWAISAVRKLTRVLVWSRAALAQGNEPRRPRAGNAAGGGVTAASGIIPGAVAAAG